MDIFTHCVYGFLCSQGGDSGSDDDKGDPRKKQLRQFFDRLAGDDNEIDAEELQDILTTSLKKGIYTSSLPLLDNVLLVDKLVNVFDIGACRVMIAMLDVCDIVCTLFV